MKGQKLNTTNSIPPHVPSNNEKAEGNGKAAEPEAPAAQEENLIDL